MSTKINMLLSVPNEVMQQIERDIETYAIDQTPEEVLQEILLMYQPFWHEVKEAGAMRYNRQCSTLNSN